MKQVEVALAVQALVAAALPMADVRGFLENVSAPEVVGDNGTVLGTAGEPGDPEIDLSPLAYNYEHEFPLEVAAPDAAGGDALIAMLSAIGTAVRADRFLGGLCSYLEVTAPEFRDRTTEGVSPHWADVSIVAHYSTEDPLA